MHAADSMYAAFLGQAPVNVAACSNTPSRSLGNYAPRFTDLPFASVQFLLLSSPRERDRVHNPLDLNPYSPYPMDNVGSCHNLVACGSGG